MPKVIGFLLKLSKVIPETNIEPPVRVLGIGLLITVLFIFFRGMFRRRPDSKRRRCGGFRCRRRGSFRAQGYGQWRCPSGGFVFGGRFVFPRRGA